LFQYAAVIGYAHKHGIAWSIPNRSSDPIWNPIHFPHLYRNEWVEGKEDVLLNEVWTASQQYQEIPYRKEWGDAAQIVLNGYWQSYKYYDHCKEIVYKAFDYPWKLNKGVCSIHVRRGDYLLYPTKHPVVTIEYLQFAIRMISHYKKITRFKFFSDDIPWCITCGINLEFPDCQFEYSTGKSETEDLIEMSCCEHNIISNSTMSWWAAELNQNPGKVIVVPQKENWFGPDNKLSVKDLYRQGWVEVPYTPAYKL
jgi:hypothetical protein